MNTGTQSALYWVTRDQSPSAYEPFVQLHLNVPTFVIQK